MAGRPKEFNEDIVLNKAINIFWSNGYEATSTEDLLVGMSINKGSLYNSFGSKKKLFSKALDHFAFHSIKVVEQKIQSVPNPIDGICLFFMELSNASITEHDKGCFMGNTLAELTNIDNDLKTKAIKCLSELEALFLAYLLKAKESNKLRNDADPEVLAKYLLNLWNGINITRRMYPDKAMLSSVIQLQLSVLK